MTLKEQFSEVLKKKVIHMECVNRNQQIEIEKLRKKNAVLHIRLAEALKPHLIPECEDCTERSKEHLLFQTQMKEKLLFAEKTIKVLKCEFHKLSRDVATMQSRMNESLNGFGWVVSEKLQDLQQYNEDVNDLNANVKQLEEALQLSQELHQKEKERRKELHNTLVQVRGNIRVHCRVRPVLGFDQNVGSDETPMAKNEEEPSIAILHPTEKIIHTASDETVLVAATPGKQHHKVYEFEKVYSDQDGQQVVSDEIRPLLTSFLDGYNVCVMAYGQTGSGKSYTMLGDSQHPGIVPRAAEELFRLLDERHLNGKVNFAVSVAEVYNNDIFDLLTDDEKREKHEIVTSGEGNKDVPTLHHARVETSRDIQTLLECGLERRAKIATKVHEHSSRSHLIVSITATFHQQLESEISDSQSEPSTPPKRTTSGNSCSDSDDMPPARRGTRRQLPQPRLPQFSRQLITSPKVIKSYSVPSSPICTPQPVTSFKTKLQFVDLAGSECVGMSGATGAALRESSYINRSLSALADVLGALSEHRSHIPYRNSRLTHLLQDSIGGDAKMLVLLCVSPTRRYLTETLQCLGFGSRARQIQRGQTKRRGHLVNSRSESPTKLSPRQSRNVQSVVRRVLS